VNIIKTMLAHPAAIARPNAELNGIPRASSATKNGDWDRQVVDQHVLAHDQFRPSR
jgi:hypothetical protein